MTIKFSQTPDNGSSSKGLREDKKRVLDLWSRIRPASEEAPFQEELETAGAIYTEALDYARHFMEEARQGKILDCREALPLVDQIIASVTRNRSAAASLAKLREHDEYTFQHCINVAVFSIIFGQSLGMPQEMLRVLGMAGIYHDIGKARIPEDILKKPERLNDREFAIIKRHALEGYRVMRDSATLQREVLLAIMQHHERHDGQGYPGGLTGQSICPLARVISLVDVYDALTSNRCYRQASTPTTALGLIYRDNGSKFYPTYVERFIKCLGVYPPGSMVRLTDGSVGVVVKVNPEAILLPEVTIHLDPESRRCQPVTIALAQVHGDLGLRVKESVDPSTLHINPAQLLG